MYVERIEDKDGNLIAITTQRQPVKCQRLGYTGIIQSEPEDTTRVGWYGELAIRDESGEIVGYQPWLANHDAPDSLTWSVYGFSRDRSVDICRYDPPSALPLPEDDLVTELLSDIRKRCWRFGLSYFSDMVQETFSLVWDAMSAENPPTWFDSDDYQGTLTKAIRQARHTVIVRSVPFPEHVVSRMAAKEQQKVTDEPAEDVKRWLTALLPALPDEMASYLAYISDRQSESQLVADLLGVSLRTVDRKKSLAKTSAILAALLSSQLDKR